MRAARRNPHRRSFRARHGACLALGDYRLKFPANFKVPPHYHKAAENVTVLTGVFYLGLGEKFDQGSGQELPAGGFVSVPPKHPHYAWAGPEETVVQVHGVGPTDLTFVNPSDDPRKK